MSRGVRHGTATMEAAAARPVPRASRATRKSGRIGRLRSPGARAENASRTHKGNTPISRNTVNWDKHDAPLASRAWRLSRSLFARGGAAR